MRSPIRLAVAPLFFVLSACATLDKDECLNADWELIGYEDGARGYLETRIADHRKACSKHGVTPDLDSYSRGRERGLKVYCTPQNGYKVGQQAATYRDVCPAGMRDQFKQAFEYGGQIRAYQIDIARFDQDISKSREVIALMEEEMDLNEALIVRGAGGPIERASLIRRNRELRDLIADEDERIERAAYEIDQLRRQVDELIENSPYK